LQLPDGKTLAALLFAGNFNYNLARRDRLNLLKQYLGQWQKDLEIFRELITQRFLERQVPVFPLTSICPSARWTVISSQSIFADNLKHIYPRKRLVFWH
jgi:hypothetical protein